MKKTLVASYVTKKKESIPPQIMGSTYIKNISMRRRDHWLRYKDRNRWKKCGWHKEIPQENKGTLVN